MKLLRSEEESTVIEDFITGATKGETMLDDLKVELAGDELDPEYGAVTAAYEGYNLSKEEAPKEEVMYDKPDEGLEVELLGTSVGDGAG